MAWRGGGVEVEVEGGLSPAPLQILAPPPTTRGWGGAWPLPHERGRLWGGGAPPARGSTTARVPGGRRRRVSARLAGARS